MRRGPSIAAPRREAARSPATALSLLAVPLFLLLSCGRPAERAAGDAGGPFPHPPDFGGPSHGAEAVAPGADCALCHAASEGEPVLGAPAVGPSCRSCHDHPHPPGFASGDAHGEAWRSDRARCGACHGEDGELAPAGLERARCTGCHSVYPHRGDWATREVHGSAALRRGTLGCVGCHPPGEDVPAGDGACDGCHRAWPHPEGWVRGEAHGPSSATLPWPGDAGCGETCHDPGAGGEHRLGCASCHDVFPHEDDWTSRHHILAQQRGQESCRPCHQGDDAQGPALPVACGLDCHGGE